MKEKFKKTWAENPWIRKVGAVILILYGIFAFLTPLTPGSWLVFVGLEILGIKFLFWDKVKKWLRIRD